MIRLIALALLVLLTGCGTKPEAPALPPLYPEMTANVRTSCPALPKPVARAGGSTMGDLYSFNDEIVGLYVECAVRDRAKLDWINAVKPPQ